MLDSKGMNLPVLEQRFCDLWSRCSGSLKKDEWVRDTWQFLSQCYQEPHRHYHNLDHIRHCLTELDGAGEQIKERDVTELALWFHDIIYVYGATDNEERSAEVFRNAANSCMPAELVDRVSDFILATKHLGAAPDTGTAFIVDIDLSGFGLPWDGYYADSMALREEAPDKSDDEYYSGKLRFLDELVSWEAIFQTLYFRERLETRARENIARFTRELRDQGF